MDAKKVHALDVGRLMSVGDDDSFISDGLQITVCVLI